MVYCEVFKFYVEWFCGKKETVQTTCMGSVQDETRKGCLRKARSMMCDHVGSCFLVTGSGDNERIWEKVTITENDRLEFSPSARGEA